MTIPRVYADFQNLDDDNRVQLTCAGTLEDLERQGIELYDGLVLILRTDDADDVGQPDELWAKGVVQFNEAHQCWVASIDWTDLHHGSDAQFFGHERKTIAQTIQAGS